MAARKEIKRIPFLKSIQHLIDEFGLGYKEAVDEVQSRYAQFKERNQRLIERQNDQSNSVQVQLISHFALLATLTLTVSGFLLTQNSKPLTDIQQFLIILILGLQIASLVLGAIDYLLTIHFHNYWAKLYHAIDEEVDNKVESGKIKSVSEMGFIENSYINTARKTTPVWISYLMVGSCLFGLLLLLLLFIAYFYDMPFVK